MKRLNFLLSFVRATACSLKLKHRCLSIFSHRNSNVANADIYCSNTTINRLMKLGLLDSALKVFDEMTERDAITWNIMISGYYRHGSVFGSLNFYSEMVSQGIVENSSTFSTVLSVCSSARLFREGLVVHCRAIVLGMSSNVYIGSALVDLYLRMGLVDIALKLFSALHERNLATWNVLLRSFCDKGKPKEMMRIYNSMKLDGLEPNGVTFCYLIQGCSSEKLVDEGMQLHCCVIKKGLVDVDLFVANALVDLYSACGSFIESKKSFEIIPQEDVISWNSMVSVCATNGYTCEALEVFRRMYFWGKKPSASSFLGFLKLATIKNNISLGKQIHGCVLKLGFNILFIHSALIDMYGKCGDIERSVAVFDTVPERTIECCNPLMTSLLRYGLTKDVIELFGLMVDENIGYDEVSLSLALKALSASAPASSCSCSLLHGCAVKSGYQSDTAVTCSLIDAYAKSGEIRSSHQLFSQLPSPNIVCFTSIISGFARNGMGRECLAMLNSMIQNGIRPDKVTFLSLLTGCNHSGLVEEGRILFHMMQSDHGLSPERQHYSCMVDLLSRAGLLDEAEQMLRGSPWKEDHTIWSSVLRSCKVYHNEQVGRRAAKMLTELEPENPSGWVQASNFYCDIGDFKCMRECQEIVVARKTRKEEGLSLIEV